VATEFIEDKKNAMVVAYKNTDQIASAIDQILSDDALRKQLILNGKNSIQEKFSLSLYIEKLTQLYV
jgi:glycosyltransferase involved in cell wall biosynthesis